MAIAPGARLGPYEVVAPLGSGGMGDVYRARDTKLGRDVAIKVLPASFANDPSRLSRFEREARVLASLNHPHIAQIYGLETSPTPFIVMELVAGETLADRLALRRLPLNETLTIGRQIADALDAAHERGIVHRDLKPANIALTENGAVKVLDFGLAKAEALGGPGEDRLTQSPTVMAATSDGVLLGTAPYMSPEQARGKAIDKRTDIWAFGCVLFEMLTGRRAFGGETISDSIAAVLEHEPDWAWLPPQTPRPVRDLLERCLQKDPKRRLRDIADADHDLLAVPATLAAATAATGTGGRSWIGPLIVGAIVGAAAAALGMLARAGRGAPEAPAFTRIVRLTSGPAREVSPVVSPDGKWVAYLSDAGGSGNVWLKFVAGGEPINLTASSGLDIGLGNGIGGLDVSPDGSRIAVPARMRGTNAGFTTWEVPAPLPGAPRRVLDIGSGMRWSADGRQTVFIKPGSAAGDALFVGDADGANAHQIIAPQNGMHIHWPVFSRDGFIYFLRSFTTVANLDPAEIYRIDPRGGGAMEPAVQTPRRALHPLPMPDGRGLIYAANPNTAELRLWWRPSRDAAAQQITTGVGEYAEPQLSADGKTLACTLYELRQSLVRINVDGKPPTMTPITDGFQGDLDPALSPDGERLAFTSSRSGGRLVWTARADGSDARPLTAGTASDERPAFSPDGRQIAFVSDRSGRRAIWVVGADGGAPRKVIDAETTGGLTWSRDGARIVYSAGAGDGPGLWMVAASGGTAERIATPAFAAEPAWSPSADVIAFMSVTREGQSITKVAFIDPAGRAVRPPGDGPTVGVNGFSNGIVAWARDGRRLAVVNQQSNATASIWLMDAETGQVAKLIDLGIGPRIRGVAWTKDGTALIVGKHDWTSDIVLMDQR